MTHGMIVRGAIILLILFVLFRRTRVRGRLSVSASRATPPAPGGPAQLGDLRTLAHHSPITPVRGPQPQSYPASGIGSAGPSPFAPLQSPSASEQEDQLGKLDSLHAAGTLTEEAYQQARARLLGIVDPPSGWSVTVQSAGDNKINAIKAVRECRRDLGLKDAKDFVEALPQLLFVGLAQADAERVKTYLEQSGLPVQVSPMR